MTTGDNNTLNPYTYQLTTPDPSTTYVATTSGTTITLPASNTISNSTILTSGYVNTWSPGYNIAVEADRLVIRDQEGRECLSFKDGVPMIGGKTIHEVVLDIIDMVDGRLPMTDLLIDPDAGKRALGKKIHERSKNKRRKKKSSNIEE